MLLVKVLVLAALSVSIFAASDHNSSTKDTRIQKAVQKEMENEKKYAKEQRFYNADEYDFKAKEIDPAALKDIKMIKPDYNYTNAWGACDNN
ncbi:hypothetical protein MNB_SV-10-159 [hydrothermal vent metagenome]|uniref:Uncharacterized protein n=1 Tax=hydrothermal vent metagenome TaxID=652676 RepID=A0A1W1CU52_9ZZZZ